jgi:hypothetical protein
MKRTILAASLAAAMPILLGVSVVQAQRPEAGAAIEASKMPESGPAVVGGTGATAGPNYKNQALSPMPGLRDEELSERPPETRITTPEVRPVGRTPAAKR